MASEVDICNLALAHLGDNATVASIKPPEGSAQAEHCARFYPVARDTLLEMHNWNFASRRTKPALLQSNWPEWKYAYATPNDCMRIISILPPDAEDDYSTRYAPTDTPGAYTNYSPMVAAGRYMPQRYAVEVDESGNKVIYTAQEEAMLRYQMYVVDPTKFSPLFVMTLSWHLASMLAGPVIKGDVGAAEAKRCAGMMAAFMLQAKTSDSDQRNIKPEHIVNWVAGR